MLLAGWLMVWLLAGCHAFGYVMSGSEERADTRIGFAIALGIGAWLALGGVLWQLTLS